MTIQAPSHRLFYNRLRGLHLPDLSVTRHAAHTGADVPLVGEKNVRCHRHFIDPAPRNLLFPLREARQFDDLGALRFDRLMASHTLNDARNPGLWGFISELMTEEAVELILHMDFVGKRDRLIVRATRAHMSLSRGGNSGPRRTNGEPMLAEK